MLEAQDDAIPYQVTQMPRLTFQSAWLRGPGLLPAKVLLAICLLAAGLVCTIFAYGIGEEAFIPKLASFRHQRSSHHPHAELTTDLVYFNDDSIIHQLGCATSVEEDELMNYTCFYHSPSKAANMVPDSMLLDTGSTCSAVYRPLLADYGRPWCIYQTKLKSAMASIPAKSQMHMKGTTLIMGRLSGPNPTHQLNVHFYYIYLWMKSEGIRIGDLQLVIDTYEPKWIGSYGLGLAKAFGTMYFLHELPQVTTFERVKFSVPGAFPFDLDHYETDKSADCNMMELASGVKKQYGLDPDKKPNLRRVVVAQRKPSESRRLNNAYELIDALVLLGYDAALVTFGELSFADQLKIVSDAAVLVGVTGSDLVSLVFLPVNAAVVEIFPVAAGHQVFTPELWHLAQMSGKQHLKYVSPYNSTLMVDESGQLIGDKPVHQVNATDVHADSLVALVQSAALMVQSSIRTRVKLKTGWHSTAASCTVDDVEWYIKDVPYANRV